MNYELAKKLKEAGFPQNFRSKTVILSNGKIEQILPDKYKIYLPSLSELIEACGKDLTAIQREDIEYEPYKKWCAVKEWVQYYPPEVNTGGYGDSPEEAVANLWLALNPLTTTKI